jgi:hypothetical protein
MHGAVGLLSECDLTAVVVGGEVIIAPYEELVCAIPPTTSSFPGHGHDG